MLEVLSSRYIMFGTLINMRICNILFDCINFVGADIEMTEERCVKERPCFEPRCNEVKQPTQFFHMMIRN